MKNWSTKQVGLLAGGVIFCLLIVGWVVWSGTNEEEALTTEQLLQQAAPKEEPEQKQVQKEEIITKKVDVKGAIVRPGVYMVDEEERILDVIEKAGGFTAKADRNAINLAQRVEDQMLIYVPAEGEQPTSVMNPSTTPSTSPAAQGEEKININTATEDALQTIQGIGPAKAQAIIQYRTEKGSFSSIEELKEVSGIGDKTYEKLKDQITI